VFASGVISMADTTSRPIWQPVPIRFHVDAAAFHLNAAASHAYTDTVEETREESSLRIIGAAAILIAVLENIHGRHLARMHKNAPPCGCQSPRPAVSSYPSPVPIPVPTIPPPSPSNSATWIGSNQTLN